MTQRPSIGSRPLGDPDAERWVRRGDAAASTDAPPRGELYSARLTLDVTPALRGRIKIVAFTRGVTVAELLRRLLERELAEDREPT